VLRIDPTWLIKLRRLPLLGQRLRLVLEYEGDLPEELLYQQASVYPYQDLKAPVGRAQSAAEHLALRQARTVRHVDGLVLMSQEHVALWQKRISKLPPVAVVPSLHDPESAGFSPELRQFRRVDLGWSDELVVIYTGNVICSWQRFPALCRFIERLWQYFPQIRLLALVRKDDQDFARQAIAEEGIEGISQVRSVSAREVAGYLCAADFGLFLRHRHPMNLVVTSAKLGEYLACGLPVITTGGNAEVLNCFIREAKGGVFVPEDLTLSTEIVGDFESLWKRSQVAEYRHLLAEAYAEYFSGSRDPLVAYRHFMASFAGTPERRYEAHANDHGAP
jgi:glycosyltransferase involved in cell wall biosynthesis